MLLFLSPTLEKKEKLMIELYFHGQQHDPHEIPS